MDADQTPTKKDFAKKTILGAGNLFTSLIILVVDIALGFFAVGLVAHTVVEIAARAFYALKNTRTPVLISIGAMVANIGLSVALLRLFEALGWPPHGGLALANSAAVTLEMIAMLWLLNRPLGGLNQPGLRASLLTAPSTAKRSGRKYRRSRYSRSSR